MIRAAVALILAIVPAALAAEIAVSDPYARSASPVARSGAAFLVITNDGEADDRLIEARSDAAAVVELHEHIAEEGGVMRMREAKYGFVVPAGGAVMLERGGKHVMFMGLTAPWKQGDVIEVELEFEQSGTITIEIPVDLERKPAMSH